MASSFIGNYEMFVDAKNETRGKNRKQGDAVILKIQTPWNNWNYIFYLYVCAAIIFLILLWLRSSSNSFPEFLDELYDGIIIFTRNVEEFYRPYLISARSLYSVALMVIISTLVLRYTSVP